MGTAEEELININVTICDRPYRLKIKPTEEETVRMAAKNISEKIKQLQSDFAGKDKQDYLAMYALTLAVEKMNLSQSNLHTDESLLGKLRDIDTQIQKALRT